MSDKRKLMKQYRELAKELRELDPFYRWRNNPSHPKYHNALKIDLQLDDVKDALLTKYEINLNNDFRENYDSRKSKKHTKRGKKSPTKRRSGYNANSESEGGGRKKSQKTRRSRQ